MEGSFIFKFLSTLISIGSIEAKQLQPKQLGPKQLEPKQLEPKQLEPKQLEPKQLEPKFIWLSERSESGVPHLSIQLENGEDVVAVLKHYNPIPVELDENRAEADPCIFKGFLQNDESAQVLVTGGCPGSNSFEVRNSKKLSGKSCQIHETSPQT